MEIRSLGSQKARFRAWAKLLRIQSERFELSTPLRGSIAERDFLDGGFCQRIDSNGPSVTISTVILNQQFLPVLGRSKRSLPKRGRREPFFFEGSRQLGNGEPRGLMGVFNFGATLSGVGDLINQVPNHHRCGFIARQACLAKYLQRVIGFRKIGMVAHRLLDSRSDTTLGTPIGFYGIRDHGCTGAIITLPRYRQAVVTAGIVHPVASAGVSAIVVARADQGPAGMSLTLYVCRGSIVLR